MKWFQDGNQVVIVRDDFVDLQQSAAFFVPAACKEGQTIVQRGLRALPLGRLLDIRQELDRQTLAHTGCKQE